VTAASPTCPSNQLGEITTNLKALLPADPARPAFDLHFDDAPTIYVKGQPERTNPALRKLERDTGSTTAFDPYAGGSAVPIAQRLADTVEENTLHMVNNDPKRTPSFTMFGNADFFFQGSNSTAGACAGTTPTCVDPKFAWNHGDYQDEIANTWVGFVGPGVAANGIDDQTWTDHVDYRPTINALLGLSDSYLDDGRVITEVVRGGKEDDAHGNKASLGSIYKQVNAPFGQFALDTLAASTNALKQPDTQDGNLKYDQIETAITNLTNERNLLVGQIRAALNNSADSKITGDQRNDWVKQGQSLLDRAHALAVANPA
jgi:hypothetical protein